MKKECKIIIECVIVAAMLLAILIMLSGCTMFQRKEEVVALTTGQQWTKTLSQTHWLVTFSIIGAGAGFLSFLNGYGKGLRILAACLLIASLTLMVSWYGKLLAIVGIVGSIALFGYTIVTKNRALKQVVQGIDEYKEEIGVHDRLKVALNRTQKSETTKNIVKTMRS